MTEAYPYESRRDRKRQPARLIGGHRDYDALHQSREALNLIFLSDCDHPPLTHDPISVNLTRRAPTNYEKSHLLG